MVSRAKVLMFESFGQIALVVGQDVRRHGVLRVRVLRTLWQVSSYGHIRCLEMDLKLFDGCVANNW